MIRDGKYIRINSNQEAKSVFEYYKQFGIKPRTLCLGNCLNYPYFGISEYDKRLLTGWQSMPNGNVVSYQEWLESICEQPKIEVDVSQVALELFAGV